MRIKFYQKPTSIKVFATLDVDTDNYDDELSWIAEILGCEWWEVD